MYAVMSDGCFQKKRTQSWPTTFLIVASYKSTLVRKDREKSKVSLEKCVLCGAWQRRESFKIQCIM